MTPPIFTLHRSPRLTLVGAGPGDPDLITVKGIKAIQAADVVLYDALVSPEILKLIPSGIPWSGLTQRILVVLILGWLLLATIYLRAHALGHPSEANVSPF